MMDFKVSEINFKKRREEGFKNNLRSDHNGISLKRDPSYIIEKKFPCPGKRIKYISVDSCGVIYILKTDGISVYDPVSGLVESLELKKKNHSHNIFKEPQGLAVSPKKLYAADSGHNRIMAFSRTNLKSRWIINNKDSEGFYLPPGDIDEFTPTRLVADENENLYVLDSVNKRIMLFNSEGKYNKIFSINQTITPVDIALDKYNRVYILDIKKIWKLNDRNILETAFDLHEIYKKPFNFVFDSKMNVYIGYMGKYGVKNGRGFIYKFSSSGEFRGSLSLYLKSFHGMSIDLQDNIYVTTGDGNEIAFLRPKKDRYSINKPGVFIKRFKNSESDFNWHKLVLKSHIPSKTQIDVSIYVNSEKTSYEDIPWKKIATFHPSSLKVQETLIPDTPGKYLWLKLDLISSDEYKTPVISSIKVFYPRNSYLRYLPTVYQEDESSKEFLERFLSIFETLSWNLDEEINQISRYFDVDTTPNEFLSWIGKWLAAVFDENWPEDKRRKFLKKSMDLYKKRGTKGGIKEIIEIYTDSKPIILENWQFYEEYDGDFKLRCQNNKELLETYKKLFGKPTPYGFHVILKSDDKKQLNVVKRILELEKPAHTSAGVIALKPQIYLDTHSYLEVNTKLSKSHMRIGITSTIGKDTI